MSERFDAYEFIAVVAPGSVIVTGLAILYFYHGQTLSKEELGVGDLGIFIILAFVVGHLLQAIGNWIETAYWKTHRGMPTNWIIQPDKSLLSDSQFQRLKDFVQQDFNQDLGTVSVSDWSNITKEIGAKNKSASRTERMEAFNRTYGLMRGISAAFLIMAILILLKDWHLWNASLICLFCFSIALCRMHRFGVHYAKELFIAYLNLKASP